MIRLGDIVETPIGSRESESADAEAIPILVLLQVILFTVTRKTRFI